MWFTALSVFLLKTSLTMIITELCRVTVIGKSLKKNPHQIPHPAAQSTRGVHPAPLRS